MSAPGNKRVRNVNNSGTRLGVHTDVAVEADTRINNGGNRDLHKESHVHGGDARVKQLGSQLTGGSQHTSINIPQHAPPPHQSTIIFPPQLTVPQATTRPWASSAFGTYYVPSVAMSITVSTASILSILLIFALCRTYVGSKAKNLKERAERKISKRANEAMEKYNGKEKAKTMENLEAGKKQWDSPGLSKNDLAHGVKTLNALVEKTAQLELSMAKQEQAVKDLADTSTMAAAMRAVEHLQGSDDARDEPGFEPKRRHRHQDHRTQSRQGTDHLSQIHLSHDELRGLFWNWTSHYLPTLRPSSPTDRGEGRETRQETTPTDKRRRSETGSSVSTSDRKPTAPTSSPEPDEPRAGCSHGTAGYPRSALEEAWASFEQQAKSFIQDKEGHKKITYSHTRDKLGCE